MVGYRDRMMDTPVGSNNVIPVEDVLRTELARGDSVAESVVPILRHLLASDDSSVFSDEVVARVRSMATAIAGQLRVPSADGQNAEGEEAGEPETALTDAIIAIPAFLGHLHALAMEWQLAERLQARHGLDPVLSPLVQALIASKDAATAELAMKFLASQARFGQTQRRMTLPITELPGDLLHSCLLAMRSVAAERDAEAEAEAAQAAIRKDYDESSTRLGLLSRLVTGMGGGAIAALSITHAGSALFLTALSIGSGQDRDAAVLATNEAQLARLALSLRAAGLKPVAIEEQFLTLHPEVTLPPGFDRLGADRAADLLAHGVGYRGR